MKYRKRRIFLEITAREDWSEKEVCVYVEDSLKDTIGLSRYVVRSTIRAKQWNRVKAHLRNTCSHYWP